MEKLSPQDGRFLRAIEIFGMYLGVDRFIEDGKLQIDGENLLDLLNNDGIVFLGAESGEDMSPVNPSETYAHILVPPEGDFFFAGIADYSSSEHMKVITWSIYL